MLQRRGRKWEEITQIRELRPFGPESLNDCMKQLNTEGYFYANEWIWAGECDLNLNQDVIDSLALSDEWLEMQEVQPIIVAQIKFIHFLTRESRYLYIRREPSGYGERTMIWLSDAGNDLDDICSKGRCVKIDCPLLEKWLQSNGLLESENFFKVSLEEFQEKTKGSLFALLYRHGYRQVRGGRREVKKDYGTEESFAWAGEFVENNMTSNYLYLVMVKRDYEEWESDDEGKKYCIWEDRTVDLYAARRKTAIDCVCIEREQPIQWNQSYINRDIIAYLNMFAEVDEVLEG